jgi:toxin ParE1/3/4
MRAKYRVEFTASAEAELRAAYDFIARDKKSAASKWLCGALAAIRSLRTLPFRHEIVPEAEATAVTLRHIIYGSYRIIYRIDDHRVRVFRVIHAARRLSSQTLKDMEE